MGSYSRVFEIGCYTTGLQPSDWTISFYDAANTPLSGIVVSGPFAGGPAGWYWLLASGIPEGMIGRIEWRITNQTGFGNGVVENFGAPSAELVRSAYLDSLLPAAAAPNPVSGNTITDPFVPGTDVSITRTYPGIPAGISLVSMTLGLRTGSPAAPISGVADRVVTTAANAYGQLLDTGSTNTQYGTVTAKALFAWSRAVTALIAPGTNLTYFVTGTDTAGLVHDLDGGSWPARMGGPLG